MKTLTTLYGIRCIDYWGEIIRAVGASEHTLSEYVTTDDPVHPTQLGNSVAAGMIEPYLAELIYGDRQYTGSLPTRIFDNGDYENDPVTKTGAENDAKTGTWTTSGTILSSDEAGATITFSATCQSWGLRASDVANMQDQAVDYQIDGGAWVEGATINRNGIAITSGRGAHTVVIRVPVGGTVTIKQFLAI